MRISLNISTCPNDTFMFDALIHKRIDTKGYEFELNMDDIDKLNKEVAKGVVDVSKISYANYPNIVSNYKILKSGGALGSGNGPLLVSRKKIYVDEIPYLKIGIPGEDTSANLLLNFASSTVKEKRVYLFSDISEAILGDEIDAGVLIHEERFSYKDKGLSLVLDLGQYWEDKTGFLVPLGAIVVNRKLEAKIQNDINDLIRESIDFAFKNPQLSYNFVKSNAKELSDDTISKHIKMFVNEYSLDLQQKGKDSVLQFLKNKSEDFNSDIFI
ncbi:MAG: 1,4-dihydroxy-6-naphthoate synthase [Rikenellaceae bacterium]